MLNREGRRKPALRGGTVLLLSATLAIFAFGCSSDDGINDNPKSTGSSSIEQADVPPVKIEPSAVSNGFDAATIYRERVPGVISVRSIFGAGAATGSGFVLNDDGEIVTNAHVITDGEGEDREAAKQVYVEFYDGEVLPAEIIGFDPFADVGLLKVNPDKIDLTALTLGDSDKVQVGEPIAVIGSPFGEDHSLSTGVVSQTGRSVRSLTDFQIENAIQTDASINPGNSGGPMLNDTGQVIGISQQIKSGSSASNGVGFGVPSNAIKASVEQLREDGEAEYAYIGVSTQPMYPQLADKLGIDTDFGALVAEVVEGGPAEKAGLQGGSKRLTFQGNRFDVGGDVIVSADGEKISRAEDLGRIIGGLQPGESVALGIIRDGETITVDVDLEQRPTALTQPQLQP